MLRVILGPSAELHRGIHGQLIESPPAGVTYLLPDHRHQYMFPAGSSDPFADFAVSETIEYALPSDRRVIVHSSRAPVFNPIPWIAEADCLLATLNCGTAFAMGKGGQTPADPQLIRLRQSTMLFHYLNDHCMGVLFYTDHAKKNLLGLVEDRQLLAPPDFRRLVEKCDVLRPTVPSPALSPRNLAPTIVYMGRFSEGKGADVALEVFRRLSARYRERIRLVFVGPLPPSVASVPAGIICHPILKRAAYLDLLRGAHIYLSPTESESYGFALLEAASHGLALVTSRGKGMEHIEEQFEDGKNALFVSTEATFADKLDAYEQRVRALIDDPGRLLSMSRHNIDLFRTGMLSLEAHDRKLSEHYARMSDRIGDAANRDTVAARSTALAAEHGLSRVTLDAAEWNRRQAQQVRGRSRVLLT